MGSNQREFWDSGQQLKIECWFCNLPEKGPFFTCRFHVSLTFHCFPVLLSFLSFVLSLPTSSTSRKANPACRVCDMPPLPFHLQRVQRVPGAAPGPLGPLSLLSAERQASRSQGKQPAVAGGQQHWIAAGLRWQLLLETDRETETFFLSPQGTPAVHTAQWTVGCPDHSIPGAPERDRQDPGATLGRPDVEMPTLVLHGTGTVHSGSFSETAC